MEKKEKTLKRLYAFFGKEAELFFLKKMLEKIIVQFNDTKKEYEIPVSKEEWEKYCLYDEKLHEQNKKFSFLDTFKKIGIKVREVSINSTLLKVTLN